MTGDPGRSVINQIGIRYIPELLMEKRFSGSFSIDGDLSINCYSVGYINNWKITDDAIKLKPYRFWGRFGSDYAEVRIGLQKINFGPAMLIRPLMWFNRIDPRDPLQLTDGVYALLSRYYFKNNTNIWTWLLYGNNGTKGWEKEETREHSPEYGGRIQIPVYTGELGVTVHRRTAYPAPSIQTNDTISGKDFPENRFALDGRWDIGIGLWFETALIQSNYTPVSKYYSRLWTIGTDYTFAAGQGLYTVLEYFQAESAEEIFDRGESNRFSALLLRYPAGILDTFSAIVFFDWENKKWYRTFTWQRSYDNWQFYLIGFWNPEFSAFYQNQDNRTSLAGRGFSMMVVFNY